MFTWILGIVFTLIFVFALYRFAFVVNRKKSGPMTVKQGWIYIGVMMGSFAIAASVWAAKIWG